MQELLKEQKKSKLLQDQLKKQGSFLDAFQVRYTKYKIIFTVFKKKMIILYRLKVYKFCLQY